MVKQQKSQQVYRKYIVHTIFQWFGQTAFYAFGGLLIYQKTRSVLFTLLFFLTGALAGLLLRSAGVKLYVSALERIGPVMVMLFGLLFWAAGSVGVFMVGGSTTFELVILLLFAAVVGMAGAFYFITSHAIFFTAIGKLKLPGKHTSVIRITKDLISALAAVVAYALSTGDGFLLLLLASGASLTISIIPLLGLRLPFRDGISFFKSMRSISWQTIIGNINPVPDLRIIAVPLIMLFLFGSLEKSVGIQVVSMLGAIIFAYVTGFAKDKRYRIWSIIAVVGAALTWLAYGFAATPLAFIVLGILAKYFSTSMSVGQESRMSREIANGGRAIEATIAIEFARAFGSVLSLGSLIIVYLATGSLPQTVLWLGILFVLPRGIYAIGRIERRHKPRSA